jgi:hypothetical protein
MTPSYSIRRSRGYPRASRSPGFVRRPGADRGAAVQRAASISEPGRGERGRLGSTGASATHRHKLSRALRVGSSGGERFSWIVVVKAARPERADGAAAAERARDARRDRAGAAVTAWRQTTNVIRLRFETPRGDSAVPEARASQAFRCTGALLRPRIRRVGAGARVKRAPIRVRLRDGTRPGTGR